MRNRTAHAGLNLPDRMLRRYVDRHYGFVLCTSLGFAITSCLALILLLGLYASYTHSDGMVTALGLCLWLIFNVWAVRRFMAFLRRRAAAETACLLDRLKSLPPLPQTH